MFLEKYLWSPQIFFGKEGLCHTRYEELFILFALSPRNFSATVSPIWLLRQARQLQGYRYLNDLTLTIECLFGNVFVFFSLFMKRETRNKKRQCYQTDPIILCVSLGWFWDTFRLNIFSFRFWFILLGFWDWNPLKQYSMWTQRVGGPMKTFKLEFPSSLWI